MNVAIKLFGIIAVQIALSFQTQGFAISRERGEVRQDSVVLNPADSLKIVHRLNTPHKRMGAEDTLQIDQVVTLPYISLQQSLKGKVSGVYVQEHSGEPGTLQSFYVRGMSAPIFNAQSTASLQPQVYLNGIPLTVEHPFSYDVQQYDVNKIGPSTNILSGLHIDNIESIEIIKDPVSLARLGPLAANGAIYITSKNARASVRDISVNAYSGVVTRPAITPVNAYYENKFRAPFYAQYASLDERLKYPSFLADSTNLNYYGSSTWHNSYYRTAPIYSANLSLSGGSPRANFRFFAGHTSNAGNSDETKHDSYDAAFFVNMAPFKWMNLTSMLQGTLLNRDRNRNFRDRFADMQYVPNMSVPIPPNESIYKGLLVEYDRSIDDNKNSLIRGNVSLNFNLGKLLYSSRVSVDYNEGMRDLFYPSVLLEGNNYMSSYFGYSQRIMFTNLFRYDFDFNGAGRLDVEVGNDLLFDTYRYNYTYGYRGPSDFIKVIVVDGNSSSPNYLQPQGVEVFRNTDSEKINMSSFYGLAKYSLDRLGIKAVLRTDGVSNVQPDSRWQMSGGLGADYTLVADPLNKGISYFNINAGWAKVGRSTIDDRFAVGPQYRVDLGWGQAVNLPSYNGFPVVSRPYSQGWVGYDVHWPYTLRTDIGLSARFLQDRVSLDVQLYQRDDKSQIVQNTIAQEYGYEYELVNGLDVRNRGIDLALGTAILSNDDAVSWRVSLNAGFNDNKLTSLPRGNQSLTLGNRLLTVGDRIDRLWLLQGEGAYTLDSEIPVNSSTGQKLSANGTPLTVGDPKWIDQNGDYQINSDDRVLMGQLLPTVTGGFYNQISYKGFDLGLDLYFALGHTALNERASNTYNFINLESNNELSSVKEIFFWQQDVDISRYPVYNPWSASDPYRLNQELFLEKLDFLKVRAVSLGYDIKEVITRGNRSVFDNAYVYLTANNLYTWTRFSGMDPELVNQSGIYDGYGMSIPRTFTLGVKLNF